LLDRRKLLKLIGYSGLSAGLLAFVGCGSSTGDDAVGGSAPGTAPATAGGATTEECAVVPEETAGPYPGDGSNGPDVLSQSGVVRSDIRSSFGELSGTAEGVPLTIKIAVQEASNGCAAIAGAAVYLWHCNREGQYSLYSEGITDQNYLRGVQETGKRRSCDVHEHLPSLLFGPLAAHPFRGLSEPRGGDRRLEQGRDVTDRPPRGFMQRRVRHRRVQPERQEPAAGEPPDRQCLWGDGGAHQLGSVSGSVDEGYVVELAVPVPTG
jgi:hypothetical protein